jgi:hypothetical protein
MIDFVHRIWIKGYAMHPDMLAVLWLPVKYRSAQQQLGKFIYKIMGDHVD